MSSPIKQLVFIEGNLIDVQIIQSLALLRHSELFKNPSSTFRGELSLFWLVSKPIP